jgi:hypothetical protein
LLEEVKEKENEDLEDEIENLPRNTPGFEDEGESNDDLKQKEALD